MPSKQIQRILPILLAFIISSWAFAQTAPEPPVEPEPIVSNATEVSLDLVVRGKGNKPVLDLKPDDIAVTDNGTPVKLSSLRLVTAQSEAERLITLVFDRLEPSSAKSAHDIAVKILKLVPDAGFSFSVLSVDQRLRLVQQFTTDRVALAKAISLATEGVQPGSGTDPALAEKRLIAVAQTGADLSGASVDAKERAISQTMLVALEESQRIVQDQHAQPALAGLLALARTERQIPGRKVVLYFAQDLRADSSANDMLLSIIGSANRAGVSIYAIDANALGAKANQGLLATVAIGNVVSARAQTPAPTGFNLATAATAPQAPPGMMTQVADQLNRIATEGMSGHGDPLSQLAQGTGGSYISAEDNLKRPFQQLIEDMTTYYEVSYVPPIDVYDGRFRAVVVKPVRAKLKIRSRAGYFALPPGDNAGIVRPFEAPLLKALEESPLPAETKFRATVLRLGELPEGNTNEVVVEVPLAELEMREDFNTKLFSVHLAVVAQVKDKAGKIIAHFSEDIPRHGAMETMEEVRSQVVTMQRHFIAAPGAYVLEAAVMDRNTGKISAQRSDFEILPAAAGPSLSDIVIVRRTDPFTWEADPLEPLRYNNGRVVPSLSPNVASGSNEVSLFLMVHPDAASTRQPRLEMEIVRNGESMERVPLQLRRSTGEGTIPYLASIQSKALAAGDYQLTAILTQDDDTVESKVAFRVPGAELASAAGPGAGAGAPGAKANDIEMPDQKSVASDSSPADSHRLVITALPSDAVKPPSAEELATLIASARERALSYARSLPNFMCVEVTNRSVDPTGRGAWKHKDSIAELLRFRDRTETRVTLEMNGKPSSTKREDMSGPLSHGEFGSLLNIVFQPASKADFKWKETDALGSETVQVLSYHITPENSGFLLTGESAQVYPGFHGLVFVDNATNGVRRVTMEADPLPRTFSMQAAAITVDYDYMAIGEHDYLMPVHATASLRKSKRAVLNDMTFRDYRRYGSKVKIVSADPPAR